jgi:hypothetical protein
MSNLTKEIRPDYTGKLVTRTVKVAGLSSSGSAIPAPDLQSVARAKDLKTLGARMGQWAEDDSLNEGVSRQEEMSAKFDAFSSDSLRYVLDGTGKGDDDVHPSQVASLMEQNWGEEAIREYVGFSMEVDECEDTNATMAYVQSLHQYSALKDYPDLTRAPEDVQSGCRTLLRATFMYSAWENDERAIKLYRDEHLNHDYPMLKSSQLVNLILDHPDRGDEIIDFLNERGYSIGLLRTMLTKSHRALSEGVL